MAELVTDCPRCGVQRISFDVLRASPVGIAYEWQRWHEAFCVCRHCNKSTVFVLSQKIGAQAERAIGVPLENLTSVNAYYNIETFISTKDKAGKPPPDHLPKEIAAAFREGATCLTVDCFNAAGTMFRLCIDHATKALVPEEKDGGPAPKSVYLLGHRLKWLFDNGRLDERLKDLAGCIKDDGNDGAHQGTLDNKDAEDIQDFAFELLERLYTLPKRLELKKQEQQARREKKQ